ncbi:hypothetical protein SAMN04488556_1905 [Halostagnicola kamekurae]|uniref:Uncharacterized protein n=1 Tax=Halostagnicola kamekurae TaxID=619731 RepID=A0A1I6RM90_9EURY|nr:hypothetical protein SAMN04488556_1905 [Halostagnicola kamekurae]
MNAHTTHHSLTHRRNNHHVTIHETTMSVPHLTHRYPDSDETLHQNSAAMPGVTYV